VYAVAAAAVVTGKRSATRVTPAARYGVRGLMTI
jgi:hypothetical protein